jgi:hypothetical protein
MGFASSEKGRNSSETDDEDANRFIKVCGYNSLGQFLFRSLKLHLVVSHWYDGGVVVVVIGAGIWVSGVAVCVCAGGI